MTDFPQALKTRRFAVLVTVVLLLGAVVGAVIGTFGKVPLLAATQDGLPLVTSASSAIRVVGVQQTAIGDNPIINVSLQNTSTKTITAYSLGSGKGWVTRDYFFAETAFTPNAIENQIIPLNSASFSAPNREFTVTGVLFDDGSTDGRAISIFRLKETWGGLRDHTRDLLPCLRKLPSTLTSQHESALVHCESEATKLSRKGRSSDYADGFQSAQREFLTQLGEIKNKLHSGDLSGAGNQRDKVVKSFEAFQNR